MKTMTLMVMMAASAAFAQSYMDAEDPIVIRGGGIVRNPDSGKGKVVVVNTQKDVSDADIWTAIDAFNVMLHLNFEMVRGRAEERPSKARVGELGAAMAIFIVDAPKCEDTLLVSPESRWAKVNIARLKEDGPAADRLVNRVQKEFSRAFALLCGGANSGREGQTTGPVANVRDLDRIRPICLPLDSYSKVALYLKGMGMTPFVETTYEVACQRGWAPAPTNDIQKAIWDKVHAIPSKPIKIEYDEKRDKGK